MSIKQNEVQNPHLFHVSLKLILKNREGETLILKFPENSSMAGFYDLPGGRINTEELDDSYENMIKREIVEELGNEVKYQLSLKPVSMAKHIFFSNRSKIKACIFFVFLKAKYLGGAIRLSDEHVSYKWIKLDAQTADEHFTKGLKEGLQNYLKW